MKTLSGFSLIELLVAMALVAIIATISFPALRLFGSTYKALHHHQDAMLLTDSAQREFTLALRGSAALGSIKAYAVFQENEFSHDTRINSYLHKHPPQIGSSALAVIHPRPELGGQIVSHLNNGFTFCFPSATTLQSDDYTWLVLGFSGLAHRDGNARLINLAQCPSGKAVSLETKDLRIDLFSTITGNLASYSFQAVIPVKESFSLYLDQQHILRQLYHRSGQNQSVVSDIALLTIAEEVIASDIYRVNVEVRPQQFFGLENQIATRQHLLVINPNQLLDLL